jgi:hypothetical protein
MSFGNYQLQAASNCNQPQRFLSAAAGAGVPSDPITFTCLIEAAVLAGECDMAQRVFARAMAAGVTSSVQVSSSSRVLLTKWLGSISENRQQWQKLLWLQA